MTKKTTTSAGTKPPAKKRRNLIWVDRLSSDETWRQSQLAEESYSKWVYMLKVVLPAVGICLMVLLVVWPAIQDEEAYFKFNILPTDSFGAKELKMHKPRFVSSDPNNHPFNITADSATQMDGLNEKVLIDNIRGDISLAEEGWMALLAETGFYLQADNTLTLNKGVNLFHDDGYEIFTPTAQINLSTNEISSTSPVKGQGPMGTLESEGFQIIPDRQTIFLLGKTRLTLYPES